MKAPRLALLLLVTLLAGLAAVSNESLWIDEGNAALKAIQPTFGQWVQMMKVEGGSDAQMPLYMAWLWGWEKLFGRGEQALRLANLPWILLGHAFLLAGLSRSRLKPRVALLYVGLAAVAPFLCYYLNEARPYAMEYGAACLVLAYLLEIDAAPERAFEPRLLATAIAGMLLLAGSSLLGVPWAGGAFLAAGWILWQQRARPKLSLASLWAFGGLCLGMGLLGFYYLKTLQAGAGASSAGKTGVVSCLFAAYEIAGLAGLGPNRAELRGTGISALVSHGFPLATGGLLLLGVGAAGAVQCSRKESRKLPPGWMLLALLLPLVGTIGLGVVGHFRILGRHLMPAFPLLLLATAAALGSLGPRQRGLVALFFAVWAGSFASLRFSPTHRKDDYRSAAHAAQNALLSGKRVWWAADLATARYYGLSFSPRGTLTPWMNAAAAELEGQPPPDLLILSKRDLYDQGGALEGYIVSHGYLPGAIFPAFTLYEKRP
ncbi:MAG: hypothetical protein NTZ46_01165 [Verrucomicrobia bacterium]|nr:hypothetical protein [Verrucomicrobiota bacterium]